MSESDMPIWSAALLAVGCRALKGDDADPVQWEIRADHARYAATGNVVVVPFGVKLSPGEVLEVRWARNDSGYELTVKRPRKAARRGHRPEPRSEP
jgi:hypothetical protein